MRAMIERLCEGVGGKTTRKEDEGMETLLVGYETYDKQRLVSDIRAYCLVTWY